MNYYGRDFIFGDNGMISFMGVFCISPVYPVRPQMLSLLFDYDGIGEYYGSFGT